MTCTKCLGGVALVSFLMLGGVAGLSAQRREPPPPPVAYRQAIMQGLAAHSGAISSIVDDGAGDPSHILDHATALVQLSLMANTIFAEGTAGERSRAKPEIWQQPEEFKTRLEALQSAASNLLQASYSGDKDRISDQLGELRQTCGGCHRTFRAQAGG